MVLLFVMLGEFNMIDNDRGYRLKNSLIIPNIGLGTWHIKEQEIIDKMIYNAYQAGYRHIDTASKYQNEKLIGNTIKKYNIDRKSLFLTSKLWKDDKGYERTLKAVEQIINNLQTDYLDLLLIHWPMTSENWKELNIETWKAFEKLYKEKKVRAIGVSNFMVQHLEALLPNIEIFPMVNQIEFHPGFMQKETLEYCANKNIIVEAWSPLGSGKIFDNDVLKELSIKYDKSIAQICIRWCLQNNVIPLPKSTNKERIIENISVYDFSITEEDMNKIDLLPCFCYSGLNPNIVYS